MQVCCATTEKNIYYEEMCDVTLFFFSYPTLKVVNQAGELLFLLAKLISNGFYDVCPSIILPTYLQCI